MAKKYEELEISDDFMYGKVTQDLNLNREVLEMATGRKIEKVRFAENQKTIIATIEGKDVKLDSYVEDDEGVVYDAEMQNRSGEDTNSDPQLPKRSRYYQGMIDINILEGGARYQELKRSYIIFFCTFDPFGKGLKRYTFENICHEDMSLTLDDGATKIFFNSKGKKTGACSLSKSQEAFLHFVETGEASDDLTRKLKNKVDQIRANKKWRVEYMKALTHDQDVYDSGYADGIEQGISQGISEGIEQGISQEKLQTYTRCIENGLSKDQAKVISGLTDEQIQELSNKID